MRALGYCQLLLRRPVKPVDQEEVQVNLLFTTIKEKNILIEDSCSFYEGGFQERMFIGFGGLGSSCSRWFFKARTPTLMGFGHSLGHLRQFGVRRHRRRRGLDASLVK